ncbi:ATP-binding protein [Parapedobacter koreensis]|uniref:AAA+ ATPase domain-containing protein n=1 Tax=Parapedobacter koreensis TaxID=332977 RepID=A0A1H7U053_9SPHI|nr:ATP-binding protein [Parapedobacter koreensis]SEL90169.1 hypothetical protein SAMN05421740_1136 [Parapedobacter koreensis]
MEIKRNITEPFEEYRQIFPAVGLLGPRQVGKTTFVKGLTKVDDFIYLDLERLADREKLKDPGFYFSQYPNKCFILDEVQFMPEIFAELRGIIDADRKPGRFLLLGSASPDLIRNASDSLAGRIGYLQLTPFTMPEVDNNAQQLWLRGGFPLAYLATSQRASVLWRRNFIQTYINRDLGLLGLQADPQLMERFWRMLASVHGNLWNAEGFARSLGITRPTVNRYLDFMEGAFMVRVLQPWFRNIKKRLVKSPKVYIRDSGLLHTLLGLDDLGTLINHIQVGASWEGFVLEQIINSLDDNTHPWFYRTQQGAECDLLLEKNGKIVAAVEIKYAAVPSISKGFRISMEDTEALKGYIIANVDEAYTPEAGITVVGIAAFIREELPKL